MALFNWAKDVTNWQTPGEDLASQLVRLNVHPKAVFFTHFHPSCRSFLIQTSVNTILNLLFAHLRSSARLKGDDC